MTGLPQDMYEDILVPLFEKFGRIWQMCLMADPFTNLNPGFCYLTYCKDEEAQRAVEEVHPVPSLYVIDRLIGFYGGEFAATVYFHA